MGVKRGGKTETKGERRFRSEEKREINWKLYKMCENGDCDY